VNFAPDRPIDSMATLLAIVPTAEIQDLAVSRVGALISSLESRLVQILQWTKDADSAGLHETRLCSSLKSSPAFEEYDVRHQQRTGHGVRYK
jgi:hypothetical protein